MSRTRVHNFSISLDGFATGEPQSADAPFGHAGQRLHEWMMSTRFWDPRGSDGVDNAFAQRHSHGIGAEIMGAGKFGPPGWQDDPEWRGWWGADPPFHTPTFVLTHRPRPAIPMAGGTTFHFLDVSPPEALARAQERVRRLFAETFAGRRIEFVDAISANWVGGGPHCATLNEPLPA